jgi:methionine-rich copper-binding protein CopC
MKALLLMMLALLLMMLLVNPSAFAANVLGQAKNGEKFLTSVPEGVPFTTDGTILFDERVDGPMPAINIETVEAYVEDGRRKLRENAALKAAYDARVAAEAAAATQLATETTEFEAIKVKILAETATAAEIRKAFKFLLKNKGLGAR